LLPFVVRVFMWPIYVATLWVFFNFSWKHAWLKLLLLLPHRPPLSQGFGFPSAASIGQNFRGGTAAGMLQMVKQISCQPIGWAWLENILVFSRRTHPHINHPFSFFRACASALPVIPTKTTSPTCFSRPWSTV
jgi:hypothetical protein